MDGAARQAFDEAEKIPVEVWQGTIPLFGVSLRCSVLDSGKRVIHAEDMEALFAAMMDGVEANEADMTAFARWLHGQSQGGIEVPAK